MLFFGILFFNTWFQFSETITVDYLFLGFYCNCSSFIPFFFVHDFTDIIEIKNQITSIKRQNKTCWLFNCTYSLSKDYMVINRDCTISNKKVLKKYLNKKNISLCQNWINKFDRYISNGFCWLSFSFLHFVPVSSCASQTKTVYDN